MFVSLVEFHERTIPEQYFVERMLPLPRLLPTERYPGAAMLGVFGVDVGGLGVNAPYLYVLGVDAPILGVLGVHAPMFGVSFVNN